MILSPPVANAASAEGEGKEDKDGNTNGSVQHRVFHLFLQALDAGPNGQGFFNILIILVWVLNKKGG